MAEMNTIYDASDNAIGIFRHGVAWLKSPRVKLGEYDDDFVYDIEGGVLAKFGGDEVLDMIGDTIGKISGKDLYVSGEKVGSFIGSKSAGAAAIVLLFSSYAVHRS